MKQLSLPEWVILTYILHYQRRWQCAPRVQDIRFGCGIDTKRTTLDFLICLQNSGLVKAKGDRFTATGKGTVGVAV